MEKKYKLLKEYPALPNNYKKGDIVTKVSGQPFYNKSKESLKRIPKDHVEGFPEYWKRVDNTFEIVEMKFTPRDEIYKVEGNKVIAPNKHLPKVDLLRLYNQWEIYSIKRMGDGEIFTIGDTVNDTQSPFSGKIKTFAWKGEHKVTYRLSGSHGFHVNLQNAEHLYYIETEDGEVKYEGDRCYFVKIIGDKYIKGTKMNLNSEEDYSNYKFFAHKESRDDYYEGNINKYSMDEIRSAFNKCFSMKLSTHCFNFNADKFFQILEEKSE